MRSKIYQQAEYYELAFNFVNIRKQINLFEKFIKIHSRIKVMSVLDIACGPALQLREFARRGYKSFGIDLSKEMLKYLQMKAAKENIKVEITKAGMHNFSLPEKTDFAYILMGSIAYIKNNNEFISHLKSVASCLNSGGLYLIENLAMTWASPNFWKQQKWSMTKDRIKINATYQLKPVDELNQTIEQIIKLEINDSGKKILLEDKDDLKLIFPQEFKTVVEFTDDFEFLGFFERWSAKKLKKASADNIILLRKK